MSQINVLVADEYSVVDLIAGGFFINYERSVNESMVILFIDLPIDFNLVFISADLWMIFVLFIDYF